MKASLTLLILLFTATFSLAQSNDLPKRDAFELNIPVSDSTFYVDKVASSRYILPDNTIQLYPGESIFVEIELNKKKILSMKTVKENLHPEKTMKISFSQSVEGKNHQSMMLYIENPFDLTLEYKATIFLMAYGKWASTTVLPVRPKLSSYEMWSDVLVTIALSEWKFK